MFIIFYRGNGITGTTRGTSGLMRQMESAGFTIIRVVEIATDLDIAYSEVERTEREYKQALRADSYGDIHADVRRIEGAHAKYLTAVNAYGELLVNA
jgi:hypothetical protein